jgi:hypothetical protein
MHGSRKERKEALRRESRLFVKEVGATVENESNSADLGIRDARIELNACARGLSLKFPTDNLSLEIH